MWHAIVIPRPHLILFCTEGMVVYWARCKPWAWLSVLHKNDFGPPYEVSLYTISRGEVQVKICTTQDESNISMQFWARGQMLSSEPASLQLVLK